MHELGIALRILEVVERHLPPDENVRVTKIHLRVGKLTAIVPDALRTCLEIVNRDTRAEGADLVFAEVPGRVKCRVCSRVSEVESPPFQCAACGTTSVDLIAGMESLVENIQIEEERPTRSKP